MPNGWKKEELASVLLTISPPAKIKTNDYLSSGKYPIVDQGKKEIAGYTNDDKAVIYNLPALIFGDHTKEIKYINYPFAVGADGVKIFYSEKVSKEYLKFLLESLVHKLPNLGYSRHFNELKNIIAIYPTSSEQAAISKLFHCWDVAIQRYQKLYELSLQRQKWLAVQLLYGKQRLNTFNNNIVDQKVNGKNFPSDWSSHTLGTILNPVKKSFIPERNKLYQQIGIRSHAKGIFYKDNVSGQELGDKRVFWVQPNCFIVNIVFAWEHAIAKTTDKELGLIASHRFPMFKPKAGIINLDYLLYFFKSTRGKYLLGLASPGGAGRNKTLGQAEFSKLQIPLPKIDEQIAITSVLQNADKQLELLKQTLLQLKKQKKGLMQQLLTGKRRLTNDNQ